MAPAAITPERSTTPEAVSSLTIAGIKANLAKTAPSISKSHSHDTTLADLDASLLRTTFTTSPRSVPLPDSAEAAATRTCSDHMITCSWTASHGWAAPELKPYGPLAIMPTASVLHYATECFEGLKLYRGYDGKLRLFRPNLNCKRMLMSTARIALPAFNPDELLKLIVKLCATDGPKWLPRERPGRFLYLRPTMIANDATLGVQKPKEAMLFILLSVFPDMTKSASTGRPGLRLLASMDDTVRAWPGGFGYAKVGANYGPTLVAQGEARQRGYDQILWLFGERCIVTEAGASNFFVVWKTREGEKQLVTAPIEDKIILDGITRRSLLELARDRLTDCRVVERTFDMQEIVDAVNEGRMLEAFAAGTAFFVAPVSEIHFRGVDLKIPMAHGNSGPYAREIKTWLEDIMYDGKDHRGWGLVVDEN
ncbi:MAG: hypothetical protein M1821_006192 [Bathelium mastoideum]|nr:MAG: hypothetical protein M1821_006192 [Bathelium mastoideum]KAI9686530.1 MAG: hypothetical protein M1822_003541 [Bathelium mastoideum]